MEIRSHNISFFNFYKGVEPFALSLLWPVRDVQEGDKISRDYLPNLSTQDPSRSLRLLAFHSRGIKENNFKSAATTAATTTTATTRTTATTTIVEPIDDTTNHSVPQSLPQWSTAESNLRSIIDDKERVLKVFCDRPDHINNTILYPSKRIRLVNDDKDADVLYLIDHTISNEGIR